MLLCLCQLLWSITCSRLWTASSEKFHFRWSQAIRKPPLESDLCSLLQKTCSERMMNVYGWTHPYTLSKADAMCGPGHQMSINVHSATLDIKVWYAFIPLWHFHSWHTAKTLNSSRHNISFLAFDKAHCAAAGGGELTSPNGPANRWPSLKFP